jgi:hypothetical protein
MTLFKIALAIAILFSSGCVLETADNEKKSNPTISSTTEMSSTEEMSSSSEVLKYSNFMPSMPVDIYCPIVDTMRIECPEIKPCTREYAPVCGNGQTFSNACEAKNAGVIDYVLGECKEQIICPAVYDPVCGYVGKSLIRKTYGNACEAEAAGVMNHTPGACDVKQCPDIASIAIECQAGFVVTAMENEVGCLIGYECQEIKPCTREYAPVCGGRQTFSNACEAKNAGLTEYVLGECSEQIICPAVYDPVCGYVGKSLIRKTYGNTCEAEAAGVVNYTPGACESECKIHIQDPMDIDCLEGQEVLGEWDEAGCFIGAQCQPSPKEGTCLTREQFEPNKNDKYCGDEYDENGCYTASWCY